MKKAFSVNPVQAVATASTNVVNPKVWWTGTYNSFEKLRQTLKKIILSIISTSLALKDAVADLQHSRRIKLNNATTSWIESEFFNILHKTYFFSDHTWIANRPIVVRPIQECKLKKFGIGDGFPEESTLKKTPQNLFVKMHKKTILICDTCFYVTARQPLWQKWYMGLPEGERRHEKICSSHDCSNDKSDKKVWLKYFQSWRNISKNFSKSKLQPCPQQ